MTETEKHYWHQLAQSLGPQMHNLMNYLYRLQENLKIPVPSNFK